MSVCLSVSLLLLPARYVRTYVAAPGDCLFSLSIFLSLSLIVDLKLISRLTRRGPKKKGKRRNGIHSKDIVVVIPGSME